MIVLSLISHLHGCLSNELGVSKLLEASSSKPACQVAHVSATPPPPPTIGGALVPSGSLRYTYLHLHFYN